MTALEGVHQITCTGAGFYINRSSRNNFDGRPAAPRTAPGGVGKAGNAAVFARAVVTALLVAPWSYIAHKRLLVNDAAAEAADAAAAAAVADHQPPAAPSVVAASAVTAASVDVDSMSLAEKRALLAKLGGFMDDERGTSARDPPKSHVTCACFLSLVGGLVRL